MSIENEITDVRDAKDFRTLTISGYKKSEVKKELINNLCESNIEPSCYWSAELICSGHFIDLWDILINFYTKHIHIGSPMLAMHLERRINDFKNVVKTRFVENELLMRNNKKIRQLFAEIVSIFCVTSKKHKLEEVKMNPEYFDMTNITNKLHAPDISYAPIVFKEDDPKEIFVAMNELSYTLSNKHGDVLMACFWVEWIMEYKKIKVKQKNPCVCERRFISCVNEKSQKELKSDQWEIIEFPAIMPSGKPVWPQYWNIDELEGVKASISVGKWNAQWMQNPTAEEGSLIKREWWKVWDKGYIPPLQHIIQSYDTAFLKKETADYSAITTWGVFYPDDDSPANLILLDAFKERLEFPELRKEALEQYRYWQPETVLIESKASGMPLTFELRKMGIPVINYTPSKGNDKHARVNAVSPIFESGQIWAPDEKFAEEVIEECASFPYGDNDDLVDSTTQAIMRFRQGGFISHPEDEKDEALPRTERTYY